MRLPAVGTLYMQPDRKYREQLAGPAPDMTAAPRFGNEGEDDACDRHAAQQMHDEAREAREAHDVAGALDTHDG